MELGQLGVWQFTDGMNSSQAAEFARIIEALGYSMLWIPESVGRDPFAHASWLLSQTETLIVGTGIASIYNRDPASSMAAAKTLAEQSGNRFVLGLGVSHRPLVESIRGNRYGKPVSSMSNYLDRMRASAYNAVEPSEIPPVVLAALGPRMLFLAAEKTQGALPYFTSPEHTAIARETMGPDAWLCVEQKVILESDPELARKAARAAAGMYLGLVNYRNNWMRLGFEESDLENGGSDRFIDKMFAWGTVEQIRNHINSHISAGANHVCIQPVSPRQQGGFSSQSLAVLEALAPAR